MAVEAVGLGNFSIVSDHCPVSWTRRAPWFSNKVMKAYMVSAMGVYLVDTKNVYQTNMGRVVWKSFEFSRDIK
jgi:hypothetical protein